MNSSASKRLKKLAKSIPDERRARGLLQILEGRHVGADYPIAILGGAMIERALEAAIRPPRYSMIYLSKRTSPRLMF
jgi:hypothetical protein